MEERGDVDKVLGECENFSCKKFGGGDGMYVSLQPAKRGNGIDSNLPEGVNLYKEFIDSLLAKGFVESRRFFEKKN